MSINLSKYLKFALLAVLLIAIIGFTDKKQADRYVEDVVVSIDNQLDNYFIDKNDVFDLVHETGKSYLLHLDLNALNLRQIEQNIKTHRFVNDAQVYHDLYGTLTIDVKQNRPMARILNANEGDEYIGTNGLILPESSHYTARVPLITMALRLKYAKQNIRDTEQGEILFQLLSYIRQDKFWSAQVAAVDIDSSYELTLYPQVTKQKVLFGQADAYEDKFKRLKIFYKEILPYRGWNKYSEVNLKYKRQIVCK